MTRALKTAGAAAFVLLIGAARPAGAQPAPPAATQPAPPASRVMPQPIPLEGPAINPSVYKVPAGAKTINVDCDDTKQTLAGALADKSGADLNIVFSGTCKEYLYIQRDGVAIRGKDATATIVGAIEITAARRILLEGFTCRDNTQLEYCIGALYGASVMLHNIKVFNATIRGVEIFNAVAVIEGLTIEKTGSTSVLIRGSAVRLEGQLNFSDTLEGCLVIDGVSSVFSKNGAITARDCASGMIVQSNSTFQAPFATFNLNHNSFAGLMLISQGTMSYGGSIVAKNNTQAGIYIDDSSSFSPFTNISGGSSLTLENNGGAGVYLTRGSYAELANIPSNTGATYGVFVDDSRLRIGHSKISDNKKADVRLQFGARAVFLDANVVGTLTCDGTELVRGAKAPCTPDAKPTATKPAAGPSDKQ